ncbi:hypothetical protein PbJCM13498_33570 [Prolixibacter bellariivorans]|uniref:Uncharacterized protein n=1 Tax=Prolixibacter bellariivorans TaxID=314319 RepID=A0A5M4B333_9BACT|nr:hypothetical protein [Prolixibacter bellariivorans]GET34494.1 hypothetical protein PbJCM13498_33570 [Prolixibacter bellariivorans]
MEKFEIGQQVRLAIDNDTVYQIIEINPKIKKGILIREFGTGNLVQVDANEIYPIGKET